MPARLPAILLLVLLPSASWAQPEPTSVYLQARAYETLACLGESKPTLLPKMDDKERWLIVTTERGIFHLVEPLPPLNRPAVHLKWPDPRVIPNDEAFAHDVMRCFYEASR